MRFGSQMAVVIEEEKQIRDEFQFVLVAAYESRSFIPHHHVEAI